MATHLGGQPNDVLFAAFLVLGRREHVVLGMTFVCFAQVGLRSVVVTTAAKHVPDAREDHDTDRDDGRVVEVGRGDRLDCGERQDDTFEYCRVASD